MGLQASVHIPLPFPIPAVAIDMRVMYAAGGSVHMAGGQQRRLCDRLPRHRQQLAYWQQPLINKPQVRPESALILNSMADVVCIIRVSSHSLFAAGV